MKNLYGVNMKLIAILVIGASLSLVMAVPAYSAMNDSSDRLSSDQAGVFSPGYINATRQRTLEIINQSSKPKSFMENAVEYVKNKLSNKVEDTAAEEVKPELKKKTSGSGEGNNIAAEEFSVETMIDSTQYNVEIGSGSSKEYDDSGRLVAEVINSKRHVYAGFTDVGTSTIQAAVNMARSGDIVLVKGGSYTGYVSIKDGVSLYGGYNDIGERDIVNNKTIISGGGIRAYNISEDTEINGFTITNTYGTGTGIYTSNSSENLRILNNTIVDGYMGIQTSNSKAIIYGNTIYGCSWSAIYTSGSSLNVTNNLIHNTRFGVTETYRSNSTFENNVVWNNTINFIVHGNSTSTIENNTIYGGSEGVRYHNSNPTVTNNIFVNIKSSAIAIYDYEYSYSYWGASTLTVSENVFYNNKNTGLSSAALSSGLNLLTDPGVLNPTSGIYSASNIINKGYDAANITTDYSKVIITNVFNSGISNALYNNSKNINSSSYNNSLSYVLAYDNSNLLGSVKSLSSSNVSSIVSGLMKAKSDALSNSVTAEDVKVGSVSESALAIPVSQLNAQEMQIATALSQIMSNPNEDQKVTLNMMNALMADVENINKESNSPGIKDASDELMQAMAAILVAQAIPDLLNAGDVANIKGVFAELNASKASIMLEYYSEVKPYYDEVKKLLLKNMAVLQLDNILSKNMMEQELADLEPSEVDKILEKVRKAEKKSFEEEYILQQEAKYRNQYVDPNKKLLEEKMKLMMQTFTAKLSKALEGVGTAKK